MVSRNSSTTLFQPISDDLCVNVQMSCKWTDGGIFNTITQYFLGSFVDRIWGIIWDRTPLKIGHNIVGDILILVIDDRKMIRIWYKSIRNQAVTPEIVEFAIFGKGNLLVSIFVTPLFEDSLLNIGDRPRLAFSCPLTTFHPPHIGDLIHAIKTGNWFPQLFHK